MPRDFSMYYYLMIAAIVVLDQIVKRMVVSVMAQGDSIPVVDQIFHITYIQNTGAAFSLMEGFRVLLIALPVAVILAAMGFLFLKRKSAHPVLLTSLAFICGGGLGNVIDRARFGYVVDYLDFRVFPIFNAADIFVCLGCGLLLLYVIVLDRKDLEKKQDGKRKHI
ncbi:MAG: signal peptidase II [Firmicutes bacterium]|nr:signal peptidase II [Bacillota bacterium]